MFENKNIEGKFHALCGLSVRVPGKVNAELDYQFFRTEEKEKSMKEFVGEIRKATDPKDWGNAEDDELEGYESVINSLIDGRRRTFRVNGEDQAIVWSSETASDVGFSRTFSESLYDGLENSVSIFVHVEDVPFKYAKDDEYVAVFLGASSDMADAYEDSVCIDVVDAIGVKDIHEIRSFLEKYFNTESVKGEAKRTYEHNPFSGSRVAGSDAFIKGFLNENGSIVKPVSGSAYDGYVRKDLYGSMSDDDLEKSVFSKVLSELVKNGYSSRSYQEGSYVNVSEIFIMPLSWIV